MQRDLKGPEMLRDRSSATIHRAGFACVALHIVFAALALSACHHDSDETQVRNAIAQATQGARDNDADAVLDQASDDFTGNDGDLDRRGLRQLLAVRALRHDATGVLVGPVSIDREGDRLVAKFSLTLTGGKPDSLLPDQADMYAVTTTWRREGRRWHCYNATWTR